jgi:hypothetical protein
MVIETITGMSMSDQDQESVNAAIAGQVMSKWVPYGDLRRLIFFVFIVLFFYGVIKGDNALLLCAIPIILMSPRAVGEILYFAGRVSRFFK